MPPETGSAWPVTRSCDLGDGGRVEPRVGQRGEVARVGQRQARSRPGRGSPRVACRCSPITESSPNGVPKTSSATARIFSVLPAVSPRVALVATGQIRPSGLPASGCRWQRRAGAAASRRRCPARRRSCGTRPPPHSGRRRPATAAGRRRAEAAGRASCSW